MTEERENSDTGFNYPPFRDDELLRPQEVALLFGVSVADVIAWASGEGLPATRVDEDGHHGVRYRVSELLCWAERMLQARPEIAERLYRSGFAPRTDKQ